MILPLAILFSAGAIGVWGLAAAARERWVWGAAFLETLVALHEWSFAFRRVAEWIRIDLLLTLPCFVLFNILMAIYAWRQAPGWWQYLLLGTAAAGPALLLLGK
jgi:hypothetical protein